MKARRILLLVLALVLVLPVISYAQDDVFRVAVVSPSATNDLAFSQSMYDALLAIQAEMGEDAFQFDFQEGTFVVDDAAVALRDWAASGEYDLVIAHGSQYGAILEELAPDFPDVAFAWGTDNNTFGQPNISAYTVAAEEGGYINGVVAAQMSESDVIGVIGPIEVGDAKAYVDGFVAGVAAENPDAQVLVNYIQSFSDVPLATEAGRTHIGNGADILTGTAQMVVGPIAVAQEEGLKWFGTQSSQSELSGDAGVMFQVYHWEVILQEIIDAVQAGTLGGVSYVATLENGGLQMEISEHNTTMTDEDREALQATVDELTAQIIAGEIDILPDAEAEATAEATEAS